MNNNSFLAREFAQCKSFKIKITTQKLMKTLLRKVEGKSS